MTSSKLKEFYSELGKNYSEELYVHKSGWGKARTRFIKKLLLRYANNNICLDVGCGGGVFLRIIDKSRPKLLIGIDISHSTLLRAKANSKTAILICADAEVLPIKTSSVDLILCSETLEHLENPEYLFSEAFRA